MRPGSRLPRPRRPGPWRGRDSRPNCGLMPRRRALKRREPEHRLRDLGWKLQRHGGKQDASVSPNGSFTECGPRDPEINERLANVILRSAKERR